MRIGLLTLIVALVGALTAGSLAISARGLKSCGTERWSVKTLTDAAAANLDLDLTHATSTTVEKLRHLKAPAVTKSSPRFPGVETSTYRVTALLMSLRRETDSDIHLVIADPKIGGSMIVEFPSPAD